VRALLLLLGLVAFLASAGPATAAKSCGEKVIDDWFDGRIDGTYPLHCYDDAIEQLPRDVRDYSSAKEDIERALQNRLRGEKAQPNSDPAPTETTPPATTQDDTDTQTTAVVPPSDDNDPSGPSRDDDPEAIPPGTPGAENASSVPLPLLLLAGLALLLVAGGAAGYIVRRVQARRVTPPAL
jgi:cobalamin biosynthesis Mg chelatase CobN